MFTAVEHMDICPLTRLYINNSDEIHHHYEYTVCESIAAVMVYGETQRVLESFWIQNIIQISNKWQPSEKIPCRIKSLGKHRKVFHSPAEIPNPNNLNHPASPSHPHAVQPKTCKWKLKERSAPGLTSVSTFCAAFPMWRERAVRTP